MLLKGAPASNKLTSAYAHGFNHKGKISAGCPSDPAQKVECEALVAFDEGDYPRSLNLFISAIGISPVSLFLSKFFRPGLEKYVIQYLVELHKQGHANSLFTQLLFTMLSTQENRDGIISFLEYIQSCRTATDRHFFANFDADAAIETLASNRLQDQAQRLAEIIGISSDLVSSLIHEGKALEAANLILEHSEEMIGQALLLRYGHTLLSVNANVANVVEQTATRIWKTGRCTNDRDFVKLFWGYPIHCFNFLKSVLNEKPTKFMVNVFISLVIPNANATETSFYGHPRVASEAEAMRILADARLSYDFAQIASVCVIARFWKGYTFVMTKMQRQSDALFTLIQAEAMDTIISFVLDRPKLPIDDWFVLFETLVEKWAMFGDYECRMKVLAIVMENIKGAIVPSVIKERGGDNPEVQKALESLPPPSDALQEVLDKMSGMNSAGKRLAMHALESDQTSCGACHELLTPPYITFSCGHNFHKRCVGSQCVCCNGH